MLFVQAGVRCGAVQFGGRVWFGIWKLGSGDERAALLAYLYML
jgi:hypothetical protein